MSKMDLFQLSEDELDNVIEVILMLSKCQQEAKQKEFQSIPVIEGEEQASSENGSIQPFRV